MGCAAASELLMTHAHGVDTGALQILLQAFGFQAWGGLGQGHDQHFGVVRIL